MNKFILVCLLLLFIPIISLTYAEDNHHQIQTRFGLAYINKDHSLVIDKIPVKPSVSGNFFLLVDKVTQTKGADYLILTSGGGSRCPASYSIVKVTKFRAIPTDFLEIV
ncbi:hypothetical protein [Commensalibacter papalotli (ex Servin-Garciduenas et al. 2014)]|uniref:Uncharacterized protein n=1 Tax=Commensalibacter papalotli (ex Servin-Garciduenas et al. 2014) TaxID=1208583 RepID=W7DUP3_9PROT|nr:hypothetical protein [Commensalibacter papalotli (ex Servin-Garciduenas et al. 2014)]EUK17978.1 hypothetical protein COMX_08295 [Commensalibacter papalotli (ex Servin-Garciduenas et al. 2014)]